MFQAMIDAIQEDTVRWVFRARLVEPRTEAVRQVKENRNENLPRQPVRAENKVGRNAPCPCGSGLKYKRCCGK